MHENKIELKLVIYKHLQRLLMFDYLFKNEFVCCLFFLAGDVQVWKKLVCDINVVKAKRNYMECSLMLLGTAK